MIRLREDDELVDVKITDGTRELILTTTRGQSLRFHEDAVLPRHRNAMGVIGIRMKGEDIVQAITVLDKDMLLIITENGRGKCTDFDEFRGHGRGTMGVRNILTDREGGSVVTTKAVSNNDEIIVMSASGIVMRTKVSGISIQKRSTRGVRIMKMDEGDRVVGVAVLVPELDE